MYSAALKSLSNSQAPMGLPPPAPDAPPPNAAPGMPAGPPPNLAMADAPGAQHDFEAKKRAFIHSAIDEYKAGKIGHEDLKKAIDYTGHTSYDEWKQENVERLKSANKEGA